VLDPSAVTRLLDEHRAGRGAHGDTIWALLNLELWYRTWIDREGIQQLAPATRPPSRLDAPADLDLVPTA
jgi:hypothetical protein